ncbi:MAG: molybdopterin-dependent oxidoreductase [Coriobacteriales bacterium]|nr:molybdopterin-dependent oxidoreductase [Coriobacteriales bacterium]
MGETKVPPSGLTRRSFLRTAGVCAGAAVVVGNTMLAALASGESSVQSEERIFQHACRNGCNTGCYLNVKVRDGKVVQTWPAEMPEERYTRCCLRGLSHAQVIYSPKRLQYPMKRDPRYRGDDTKWERISWEQAVEEITAKLKQVAEEDGEEANYVIGSGSISLMSGAYGMGRFKNALGMTSLDIACDSGNSVGIKRVYGPGGWFSQCTENGEVQYADTIVIFGSNLTISNWDTWTHIVKACEHGAKLIVIDPEYTIIASKADWWIPINPSTDAALFMGMIRHLLDNDMLDDDWMGKATVAPVLVRKDNGKYLRLSDLGITLAGKAGEAEEAEGATDDPVVYDTATRTFVGMNETTAPALHGTYKANGTQVETALDLLSRRADEYTSDMVEGLTGISEDDAVKLAEAFVNGGTVAAFTSYGTNAYWNGANTGHAFATLIALTGQIGKKGTIGNIISAGDTGYKSNANALFMFPEMKNLGVKSLSVMELPELLREGTITKRGRTFVPPRTLWCANNTYSSFLGANGWDEVAPHLEMIVHVNRTWTDTATKMADYLLPACHWFETEDVHTGPPSMPYAMYCEKAIEPQFESLPDQDIRSMVARAMGYEDWFPSFEEQMEILTTYPDTPTLEEYRKEHIFRHTPDGFHPQSFEAGNIGTGTKRFEFYCENPLDWLGSPIAEDEFETSCLPCYEPAKEVGPDNALAEKFPFVLLQTRYRYLLHSQYYDAEWLREFDGSDPFIDINPADAQEYGLEDMGYMKVSNDRDFAVARVHCSDAIRRGTLIFPQGFQEFFLKSGRFHGLHMLEYNPQLLNANFADIRVKIEKWEEE